MPKIVHPKEHEIMMIKFLRFRMEDPTRSKLTYMPYRDIAKYFTKSVSYVHKICKQLINGKFDEESK